MRQPLDRLALGVLALASLASCAQLPSTGPVIAHGPSVDLQSCRVSVQFSGTPSTLTSAEMQSFAKSLGDYAKWDVTAWRFTKFRLVELAVCMCRDYPIPESELGSMTGWNEGAGSQTVKEELGATSEFWLDKSADEKLRMQIIKFKDLDRCVMAQYVQSPDPYVESRRFFSSPTPLAKVTGAPLGSPSKGSVAERLRQLDQLRKDRLITEEEYSNRRRVVLDSL